MKLLGYCKRTPSARCILHSAYPFRLHLKTGALFVLAFLMLVACAEDSSTAGAPSPWYPRVNAAGDPVFAVFESRLPCLDEQALATPGCERVKLALVLYRNPRTAAPTTYLMSRIYVGGGDRRYLNEGNWTIDSGIKKDAHARVYELDANAPADFRSYWVISSDIIFVLDRTRAPRLGDAGHGYALNRTD